MIGQKIKSIDLIEIANAAKAFKQRDVVLYRNHLYGLDNISTYIIHTSQLNLSCLYPTMLFNYRTLSSFLKNITTEEFFLVDEEYKIHTEFKAVDEKMTDTMCVYCNHDAIKAVQYQEETAAKFVSNYPCLYEEPLDVTKELDNLFALRKTDGTIYYTHECQGQKYFITLFSGLVPLNKADKLYLNIIDNGTNFFIVNLRVDKKNIKIISYIAYLKV